MGNIEANTEPLERMLEFMADTLLKMAESRYRDDQANNLKKLARHVKLGGNIKYNLIPATFRQELEKELVMNGLTYAIATSDGENIAYMIKDKDQQKFLDIQYRVISRSTDYVKNLNVKDLLEDMKHLGIKQEVPIISYESEAMAEIAAQKLYNNGVVCGSSDNKILIHQSSLVKPTGDFVGFELEMALEQTVGDLSPSYLEVRKKQALYDKKQLDTFAKNIKLGVPQALVSQTNTSNTNLFLDTDGNLYAENKKDGKIQILSNKEIQDMSVKSISTRISNYANDIYDMKSVPLSQKDAVKSANPNYLESDRPEFSVPDKRLNKVVLPELQNMLKQVEMQVNKSIRDIPHFEDKPFKEQIEIKEAMLINELGSNEIVTDYCANDTLSPTGQVVVSASDKKSLVKNLTTHFIDKHEKSTDETEIDFCTIKEARKMFEGAIEQEMDAAIEQAVEPVE